MLGFIFDLLDFGDSPGSSFFDDVAAGGGGSGSAKEYRPATDRATGEAIAMLEADVAALRREQALAPRPQPPEPTLTALRPDRGISCLAFLAGTAAWSVASFFVVRTWRTDDYESTSATVEAVSDISDAMMIGGLSFIGGMVMMTLSVVVYALILSRRNRRAADGNAAARLTYDVWREREQLRSAHAEGRLSDGDLVAMLTGASGAPAAPPVIATLVRRSAQSSGS